MPDSETRTSKCAVCGTPMVPPAPGMRQDYPYVCSVACYNRQHPTAPSERERAQRMCDEVSKRLAFDAALRQRFLRGAGPAPFFKPCAICGTPVEQGRFVAYALCGSDGCRETAAGPRR